MAELAIRAQKWAALQSLDGCFRFRFKALDLFVVAMGSHVQGQSNLSLSQLLKYQSANTGFSHLPLLNNLLRISLEGIGISGAGRWEGGW